MALPGSGSLSLKNAAGAGRSISQEVDGNETGSKSLTTLSVTAGKTAPHGMLEFYGYSTAIMTNVSFSTGAYFISTIGATYRESAVSANLTWTNSGLFAAGTFGVQILRYVYAVSNQIGASGSATVTRTSPPSAVTACGAIFGAGLQSNGAVDNLTIGSGSNVAYYLRSQESGGAGVSVVQAATSVRIMSVWVQNTVIPTATGLTAVLVVT